jgi:prepilin-type processing-associated H-X9-DG protein
LRVPIHYICPHCGATTDIAEKYAGQTGPCAHCGKPITIPLEGGIEARPAHGAPVGLIVTLAIVTGLVALGVLVAKFWLPAVSDARESLRLQCMGNLNQLALAMRQYEVANGCFPPAFIPDKNGRPKHSWRVLLLPYLGQQDLYDRYRFDEPWDSPHNRTITDLAIGLYQCPAEAATKQPLTNYMMVVGPHTISSGSESRKIAEITDGLANTIMLVEVADSATWWAEPNDLHFDRLSYAINGSKRQGISSAHPHGANVAFCDGTVRFLEDSTNPQLVKALLTIDGGERIPAEY